jgi:tetratricopeptide (TPR) repeat protein
MTVPMSQQSISPIRDFLMRYTPAAVVSALFLATVSSTVMSAPPAPAPISELSRTMQAEGERLRAEGHLEDAIGYFETALVADPRNADAYVGLGRVAQAQDLPGKAIGYFREALALSPDSRSIIAAQGEALAQRGAVDKARQNLGRVETLCGQGAACPEARALQNAIATASTTAATRTAQQTVEVIPDTIPAAPSPQAN